MKLSFSLPPKSRSTVLPISEKNDEGNVKEFVTEFDPSKTLTDTKPRYVLIPPIEDRRKVIKNIHLPLQSASGLKFEADNIPPSGGSEQISYGLNLRQNVEEDKPASKPEPVEQMLLKSMRKHLESLPDAPLLEDFESVPVEGFGEALLAGYGWKPGQEIGLKPKEDVQIVEHNKWVGHSGIGFNPMKESGKEMNGKSIEKLGSGSQKECRVVRKRSRETEGESQTREKTTWLRSRIRVRVISKDVKSGRLYLKKAVVTDVVGPTTCDITMDESQELVQGIDQEFLETALPKRGGPVLVLSGRHKGVYGSLVEKDLEKETGVV
ncbi:hypothetical protein EUTSA_v10027298mg [Eutrema salsugineum]|uniref:G-patch domain-containing protein n=1 Tax=Eutrema salsugineum TaxID=72664 RepID=V4P5M1_EUTSA|nr:hypothetical protein EUTSA_v10027298mg [Eutrema salsugineum]